MAVKVAAAPQTKRIVYDSFKGVDFSKDELLVDRSHSPYCVNVISDKGGQPEKRAGWRILHTVDKPVNCIAQGTINGENIILIHGGRKLYEIRNDEIRTIKTDVNNAKSCIFFADHKTETKAFIMTGDDYLCFDGNGIVDVDAIATIPLFMIAKSPEGNDGVLYEPLNLIQTGFTEAFAGTADGKEYQLSFGELDRKAVEIQVMGADGVWAEKKEDVDFTVDRTSGRITFLDAPGESAITGEDNVKITAHRVVDGYADRIKKCTIYSRYGVGGNNRIFVSGNPDYKAYDWHSELDDPTYFPDTFYAVIGNSNTAVMGYAKLGENQLIVKEDNQQDTTVFTRSAQMSDTEVAFPVKIGITGTGAISPYSFAQLIDEPLFLARNGVYAVTSNAITYERTLQNRSFFVDAKLTKEPNLENAVATVWDNYYLIAVNGNVYLLDSRQKSYTRENPNGFAYECFYWENVNARCWMVHNGELYFGDNEGNFCKFNTDIKGMSKYNDDGQAITAVWTTKLDDDDYPEMLKTMQKKGCVVTTKPFTRSSIKVGFKTSESNEVRTIKSASTNIFDFNDVDFEDLTFDSTTSARTVVLRTKVKKYKALQFVLVNDKRNQGFGVFNITKNYTIVNYMKR
jgi:hypothetical protein